MKEEWTKKRRPSEESAERKMKETRTQQRHETKEAESGWENRGGLSEKTGSSLLLLFISLHLT